MADEIRVDYAQLQQVAAQFLRQATAINQTQQQVKRSMGQLQSAWVGQGSSAFFTEMSDKVLPATNRLYRALQDASKTTRQIAQLMKQAENDAAAPFRTGAESESAGLNSAPTQTSSSILGIVGIIIAAPLVILPIAGLISNISRSWSTSRAEKDQIKAAQKALQNIKGLKPDEWSKLDVGGRTEVIRQLEEALAKAQGRPAMQIEVASFPGEKWGETNGLVLRINDKALEGNNLHRVLETVAHEGRHAYQDYAIQHPGFHPDAQEVEAWHKNLDDYQDPYKVGLKRYWNQAVEQDARHFGDQFADSVAPQSIPAEILEEVLEVTTGLPFN